MSRWLVRLGAALALALAGLAGAAHARGSLTASCAAPGPHATLAVDEGDGTVRELCIGFSGSVIAGDELLRAASSLHPDIRGQGRGETICQVDGVPTPEPGDCFGTSAYWALFTAAPGGSWQYSHVGIGAVSIPDGGAEGLRFDPQPPAAGSEAAPRAATTVCPAAAPAPPPTAAAPGRGGAAIPRPNPATPRPASASSAAPASAPAPDPASATAAATAASASGPVVIREVGRTASPAGRGDAPASWLAWALGGAAVLALAGLGGLRLIRRREPRP